MAVDIKKIDKLTEEQQALLPVYKDRWTAYGHSTDPTDMREAVEAAKEAYRCRSLTEPHTFLLADSPLQAAHMVVVMKAIWYDFPDIVKSLRGGEQAYQPYYHGAIHALNKSVMKHAKCGLQFDSVKFESGAPKKHAMFLAAVAQICDWLYRQGDWDWRPTREGEADDMARLEQELVLLADGQTSAVFSDRFAQLFRVLTKDKNLNKNLASAVSEFIFGNHDTHWLAFYAYMGEVLGVDVKVLDGLFHMAKVGGWWSPYDEVCIFQHRHNVLSLDDRNRLHSLDGPAVGFPDGFAMYCVHSVPVDHQIIMEPHTQTIAQIKAETNEEIRRIRIDKFTWERYLQEGGAKVVHKRFNAIDHRNEALVVLGDDAALLCTCPSTNKMFAMPVPKAECKTCEQAQEFLSSGKSKRTIGAS